MSPHNLYANTPPTKLFIKVAIPSIISMLMASLSMVADGAFVGKILGSPALAAVNLVIPLIFVNFSIADLIGVGSSVPLAIKLGERDEKAANIYFYQRLYPECCGSRLSRRYLFYIRGRFRAPDGS
jgi:Na+-driven multidrug efflux pump